MTSTPSSGRSLFVAPLLVEPEAPEPEPYMRYDEERDLTLLGDGTPLVESTGLAGTNTVTKSTGERDDADEAARVASFIGTMTSTAIRAEREDEDAPVAWAWGGTQLDTRQLPTDVKQD